MGHNLPEACIFTMTLSKAYSGTLVIDLQPYEKLIIRTEGNGVDNYQVDLNDEYDHVE